MKNNKPIVLLNANVIDVKKGNIFKGTVYIEKGIISEINNRCLSIEDFDNEITLIEAENKWVMPGLIDMHVHIKDGFAPLFTAAGITTVRNTGGNVMELDKLRSAPGDAPTPSVFSADRVIDGPPGLWGETSPWNINIEEDDAARTEVKRQVNAGADFIKVYGWLPNNIMKVVVEEAKRYGKEVSCDLIHSKEVNAIEAGALGIRWNEHASGIIQAMYPEWSMSAKQDIWNEIIWQKPDYEKIKAVCSELIQYGVVICPTMTLFDQMAHLHDYWKPENDVIEKIYENTSLINQWKGLAQYEAALTQMGIQAKINKEIAKAYFDMGGTVVAGTDTPAGVWTFPGMALHKELELFVEAGFSELDAIRAATCVAAEAMNQSDIGHIEVGRAADLVILNSNPLDNIQNTKDIDFIIKGGKVYTQKEIFESIPTEADNQQNLEEFIERFNGTVSVV
ncbi:amidohydrolase family protein [Falsibacillus pallidus]|uniref:Amidohydrolase family protein n=1 Tax=Falsibacillus pallidus TaxID=493781 RepID=A0A370GUE1_9BACI|nr:amidohydrolase family protein [Falsibacillus pallidus]RDI45553.1 amidohydrolase family protein [Falsibacillus pallidus]